MHCTNIRWDDDLSEMLWFCQTTKLWVTNPEKQNELVLIIHYKVVSNYNINLEKIVSSKVSITKNVPTNPIPTRHYGWFPNLLTKFCTMKRSIFTYRFFPTGINRSSHLWQVFFKPTNGFYVYSWWSNRALSNARRGNEL